MFILKVFVGVLSIIFAVKIGKDKASNDKEEYLYFKGLVNLCDRFLSDLSYKKSTIDSVLNDNFNSKELNETINSFLNKSYLYLPSFLNGEERFLLCELFSVIGKSDSNAQIESLTAFKKEINKISIEKYEKYKKFNLLFVKLGFLSGLLIFILVI